MSKTSMYLFYELFLEQTTFRIKINQKRRPRKGRLSYSSVQAYRQLDQHEYRKTYEFQCNPGKI